MVNILYYRHLRLSSLFFVCLLMLTGCPGSGDQIRFDETALVSRMGEDVCFRVSDAQDYKPAIISINPRHTPSREKKFTDNPVLLILNGMLCIPPSFYRFPNEGQFIVEYVLTSLNRESEPRKVVVTLAVSNGRIYNTKPSDQEITRPYGERTNY